MVVDGSVVLNSTINEAGISNWPLHRANRPYSLISWVPVCYSDSIELWVTRRDEYWIFPDGPWRHEDQCMGRNEVCHKPISKLYYYIHLEQRPGSDGPSFVVEANRTREIVNVTRRPLAATIFERSRDALAKATFDRRTIQVGGKAEFVFKGDKSTSTTATGAALGTLNVIRGLFIRVPSSLSSSCDGLNISIQFDGAVPHQVHSMPLDLFCGKNNRKSDEGPIAVGWNPDLSMCVVALPMPYLESARLIITSLSTIASIPAKKSFGEDLLRTPIEFEVFANITSHARNQDEPFQYFSAQFFSSTEAEVCHGRRIHSTAYIPNGTSGKLVGVHWYSDVDHGVYEGNHIIQWNNLRGNGYFGTGLEDFFYLFAYFSPDGTEQKGPFTGVIAESRFCPPELLYENEASVRLRGKGLLTRSLV